MGIVGQLCVGLVWMAKVIFSSAVNDIVSFIKWLNDYQSTHTLISSWGCTSASNLHLGLFCSINYATNLIHLKAIHFCCKPDNKHIVGVILKKGLGGPQCQAFFWYDNDKDFNRCVLLHLPHLFFSIRNKKNEKKSMAGKTKSLEESRLSATFIPAAKADKINNRAFPPPPYDYKWNSPQTTPEMTPGAEEDNVQITYRPLSKDT